MHSRIYQLENDPVTVADRACQDILPDWFTESIADYVVDIDQNREDEIKWLMETNFGDVCKRAGDRITFNIDIGAFFDKDFRKFQETIENLSKVTFNHFVKGRLPGVEYEKSLDHLMYLLRGAYDDKFGFYVWHEEELYTMQSWMREVAEPCGVYYIGGIMDYHF